MIPATQALAEEAKIAALKRLITSLRCESLETLEDSVEAFLWGSDDSSPDDPFAKRRDDERR